MDFIVRTKNARYIQNLLYKNGFKTLAAGGCVRDFLLGIEPKDIDLATEALPEQVIRILQANNIKVIETGLKHGTVTAVFNELPEYCNTKNPIKENIEITTLRIDKVCKGREAEVEFIKSFKEDAERRDLTVNALFMDLNTKEIIDYVGGKQDIENRILKFVGDPKARITEDFLRILRLFRFASKLGFNIEPESSKQAIKFLPFLCFISEERIQDELLKLLIGDYFIYIPLNYPEVILQVLPELRPSYNFPQNCSHHYTDVFNHTMEGVQYLTKYKDPILSFAHILHDVAKPFCHSIDEENGADHFYEHAEEGTRIAAYICDRLKFSSSDTALIRFLIENHMRFHNSIKVKTIRRIINECKEFSEKQGKSNLDIAWKLLYIFNADYKGMKKDYEPDRKNIEDLFLDEINKTPVISLKSPLNGLEIMEITGIDEGKKIGKIKEHLKNLVISGDLTQDDKVLAKEYLIKNLSDILYKE